MFIHIKNEGNEITLNIPNNSVLEFSVEDTDYGIKFDQYGNISINGVTFVDIEGVVFENLDLLVVRATKSLQKRGFDPKTAAALARASVDYFGEGYGGQFCMGVPYHSELMIEGVAFQETSPRYVHNQIPYGPFGNYVPIKGE